MRATAGVKLFVLAVVGLGVSFTSSVWVLSGVTLAAWALSLALGVRVRAIGHLLYPLLISFAILLLIHGLVAGWFAGITLCLQLLALTSCAGVVSLTTPLAAMIDCFERILSPLRRLGVSPERVALSMGLALRFLPLIVERARMIETARRARGVRRSVRALLAPLLIAVIRLAERVAEALDARGLGGGAMARPDRRDEG